MLLFSQTAERIAATTKKLEKTAILASYFNSVPVDDAAIGAVFFSGRPFPVWEETTLQVGGSLLWRLVSELSGKSEHEVTGSYRKHGDLGAVAEAVLPHKETTEDTSHSFALADIERTFREISNARGPAAKGSLVRQLLSRLSPLEAKYVVKIMTGDLRIGLKESLVEEAIAKAFGEAEATTLKAVQRANMLLGDIGETLRLAAERRLGEAKMRLFHPIGFMLATPAESAEDALTYFDEAWVEDKYDGIRAQAHCSGEAVRFFSRTRDEITESFPELPDVLAGLPQDAILDGEIVAWSYTEEDVGAGEDSSTVVGRGTSADSPDKRAQASGQGAADQAQTRSGRALPFTALQQRLGRKKVSEELIQDFPVAYVVFDVLYANGELLIDHSLRERAKVLEHLLAGRTSIHHRNAGVERRRTGNLNSQIKLEFHSNRVDMPQQTAESALRSTNDEPRATTSSAESQGPRAAGVSPSDDDRAPRVSVIRAPEYQASSAEELNQLFEAAQARGNEGLMIKDPESPYAPGRRGKSWLKLKRELATLDVVVTAVEYGHGRRIGVLSDYTFAVRDGDRLLNVGKAYSGLTDLEIAEMTKWFWEHTIEDQGFRRTVEPKIVLEVAFNNVMKSDRHASGYALRFPRIVRLRPDKLPEEADTLERVEELYTRQGGL
jgi:DNA ligase-1